MSVVKQSAGPSGGVYLHNTFCTEQHGDAGLKSSNLHFQNNLFLGWEIAGGSPRPIFRMDTWTNYSSSDYNGFRPNEGAPYSFQWNSPPFDILADYTGWDYDDSTRVQRLFNTLKDYSQATGQDQHSILVDYNIFVNVTPPDPNDYLKIYKPQDFDFQLNPNAVAVDAGCILPNINDNFTGNAPDLGALEVGRPVPHYGPRP
jgi:hypothetical protein